VTSPCDTPSAGGPLEVGGVVVRIPVAAGSRPYEVLLGPHLLDRVGPVTREETGAAVAILLTDDVVGARYAGAVAASLRAAGVEPHLVSVPSGESSKDWAVAGRVLERMAETAMDRTGAVVALGGGVVGDLAGFCSAVYLRGVAFVQVPTTLLAQVDSSVGGKTGLDLPHGKNLVGAFWQPSAVLADTRTLETLPTAEWRSGLAEVAKGAFLDSERFVALLERACAQGVMGHDSPETRGIIADAIAFKARVVAADEREDGEREVLNYGHTFGHALEKVLGYGTVSHGAAVAEGIRFASRLAQTVIHAPASWTARQAGLLEALGLPPMTVSADPDALMDAMRSDKKARAGRVRFVLSSGPGSWEARPVDDDLVMRHLEAWASGTVPGEE
jgi:3-dehydroquinate synthase